MAVDHELNVHRRATRGSYFDLAAPDVNVWTASAQGTGSLKSGTSYAVPFVSAAAGVLLASRPDLDMTAVRTRLEKATLDLGQPGAGSHVWVWPRPDGRLVRGSYPACDHDNA
jgi:subtilisin family serine protease